MFGPIRQVSGCSRLGRGSICLVICWIFLFPSTSLADRVLRDRLERFISSVESRYKGKPVKIGISVSEASARGEVVYEHLPEQQLVPASVVKIVTSLAALKLLGAEYRFPTEVFVDRLPVEKDISLDRSAGLSNVNKKDFTLGNLYVRGYGDPSMIDERLWELARSVHRLGVREVNNIVIDDTLFIDPPRASGYRPYEAGLSAVSLNHNCYAVHVSPSAAGAKAFVELTSGAPYNLRSKVITRKSNHKQLSVTQSLSSESFNPVTSQQKAGSFRIASAVEMNVDAQGFIGQGAEAQTIYRTVPYPPSYFGAVLRHFLEGFGVKINGDIRFGETPSAAQLLLVYESESLAQILRDLNHYSNNFIAGQLQFAIGQDNNGYFRRELGLQKLASVLEELQFPSGSFVLADASGLNRANRLSVKQLVQVLLAAYNDFSVAPHFVASLSRFGKSGTLEKREAVSKKVLAKALRTERAGLERRSFGVWGKTGTLNSVSSLAGYLEMPGGRRAAFAIVINGLSKTAATKIEDELVEILLSERS